MEILRKTFRTLSIILMILTKFIGFMVVMLFGAYLLAPIGNINSKDIEMSLFTNTPNETMMLLLNSEYFSGYLFAVTITFVCFVCYLFWQLHEIAVHKEQNNKSIHIQLVSALSLCGLFIHKAWWVVAVIIAFANWKYISASLSQIIRNGLRTNDVTTNTNMKKNEVSQ
jgi:hypothetical protein